MRDVTWMRVGWGCDVCWISNESCQGSSRLGASRVRSPPASPSGRLPEVSGCFLVSSSPLALRPDLIEIPDISIAWLPFPIAASHHAGRISIIHAVDLSVDEGAWTILL